MEGTSTTWTLQLRAQGLSWHQSREDWTSENGSHTHLAQVARTKPLMIMHAIPGIRKVCFHETLALLQSTVKQESSHGVIFTQSSFIKNPHSFLNTWTPIQD